MRENAKSGKLVWWKNEGSAAGISFPGWFYAKASGPNGPWSIVLSTDGTIPSIWSHWMPKVDDAMPAPPREDGSCEFRGLMEPIATIESPATLGTPLAIEILLQAHCMPGPISNPEAPAVQDTVAALVMMNAIERTEAPLNRFRTTKLGSAWVDALCRVPIPRRVYLDEQGRELEVR